MIVCPVPKISQVMVNWRRRASHLGRFTLWHNGCRATHVCAAHVNNFFSNLVERVDFSDSRGVLLWADL